MIADHLLAASSTENIPGLSWANENLQCQVRQHHCYSGNELFDIHAIHISS